MNIFFDNNGDFILASAAASVALISAIASWIFSYQSLKNTKESMGNQLLIEQNKIDASIIASSRINWIEKVRTLTADIIAYHYSLKTYEDIDYENKVELKRKAELLKLYFSSSHDVVSEDSTKAENINRLKDLSTNKGKNGYVRQFIHTLVIQALSSNYVKNNKDIIKHENKIQKARNSYYDLEEDVYAKVYNVHADEEIETIVDREIPPSKEHLASEIWSEINYHKKQVNKLVNDNKSVEDLFKDFGEIISIYLKIEWDISKTGK